MKVRGGVNRKSEKIVFSAFFIQTQAEEGTWLELNNAGVPPLGCHVNQCAAKPDGAAKGGPGKLAYDATETAADGLYWLLYFGLRLDNIVHTGMFFTGINDHLVAKLVLQVSVSSCFRGKTRFFDCSVLY